MRPSRVTGKSLPTLKDLLQRPEPHLERTDENRQSRTHCRAGRSRREATGAPGREFHLAKLVRGEFDKRMGLGPRLQEREAEL